MRISITKTKNHEFLYIKHSYRDKFGKSTSKNVRKLGSMASLMNELGLDRDGVIEWAKKEAEKETQKYNEENESVHISLSPTIQIKKDEQQTQI